LEALKSDNREVMVELQKMRKDPAYKSAWVPKSSDLSLNQKGNSSKSFQEKGALTM
jgi:hypothetical protein